MIGRDKCEPYTSGLPESSSPKARSSRAKAVRSSSASSVRRSTMVRSANDLNAVRLHLRINRCDAAIGRGSRADTSRGEEFYVHARYVPKDRRAAAEPGSRLNVTTNELRRSSTSGPVNRRASVRARREQLGEAMTVEAHRQDRRCLHRRRTARRPGDRPRSDPAPQVGSSLRDIRCS
jgi:hypothetical protein